MPNPTLLLAVMLEEAPRYGGAEGPDYTRYLLVCATAILAVIAGGYGVRRLVGRTLAHRAASRSLRVLDVLPLGSKQRLCVVQCYDRTFVLGQGDKEVRLVAELDPVTVEPEPGQTESSRESLPSSFRALLEGTQKQIARARGGKPEPPRRSPGNVPRIEEIA